MQGFRQQALAVSTDPEHRFELALQLGDMKTAHQLATEAEVRTNPRAHNTHTHTHFSPWCVQRDAVNPFSSDAICISKPHESINS